MSTADDEISNAVTPRAFWVVSPGVGEIRNVSLPQRTADEVFVRTLFSGISRGTETLVFTGRIPESEYERMRAPFQEGGFPGPVKYGYSNVGIVEDGPAHLVGKHVFALYPHQTHFVIPAGAVRVLPAGVPLERAVLAANLETAVNGGWDADARPGDRVVVIGAGVVGCLTAWILARSPGVTCILSDTNPQRSEVAQKLGLVFALPDRLPDAANVIVHASGSPAGLVRALEIAARDATIVEMSWYGNQSVCLPLGGTFHSRRLTIKSSQVGGIPPARRGEWTFEKRMDLALSLLTDSALDALISGESAFEQLPDVMARLATAPGGELCRRIRY